MSSAENLWYKHAVFYELYVRAFYDSNGDGHGDLQGVIDKLDYLQHLGVDSLWLLPVYPSPLRDDGYDISDYFGIHSQYGNLADFKRLIDAAHQRGLRVIADLVLNHTSDQHPWFQAARASRTSPYRDYYVWSDDPERYKDARIIFLDTEKSNWTWDEVAGQYFWHRFYSTQPDLNFDSPVVRQEMLRVMRFWLDLGIDGFRADAVPYLIERDGTNCENLPETHDYLQELRQVMDAEYPGRVLLCEANQWPQDVRPYFGNGDEFHMGFHFPVMPRIYMALHKGDIEPLVWILAQTPPIPDNCQWCIFLRNHDELTLEMVTEAERQWMWQAYAPDPRMRLNLGIRRRLAPLLDNDRRKLELVNSLLFTLPGSPIIYYGDEIGMGDNIWLPDRNGVRTPMQWSSAPNAGFSSAPAEQLYSPLIADNTYGYTKISVQRQHDDPVSLLNTLRRMIQVRKHYPAFGLGSFDWINPGSAAVAAYLRRTADQRLLILNNLSAVSQPVHLQITETPVRLTNLLNPAATPYVVHGSLKLTLAPYEYLWFSLEPH